MGRDGLKQYEAKKAAERAGREADALELMAHGRYDEAEALVKGRDNAIEDFLLLARLYEGLLRAAVAGREPAARVEELRRRALSWAKSCFPEPHTEYEGEQQEAWWAECDAKIGAIVGGRP